VTAPGPVAIEAASVTSRVAALGAAIASDHPGGLVLMPVMPEAGRLAATLATAISVPVDVDPLHVSRYGDGARAALVRERAVAITGRAVVVVAVAVDTGLRLRFALRAVEDEQPASVAVCALLDRRARRLARLPLRYVGFDVPDCLFAGWGLGAAIGSDGLEAIHYVDAATAERARRRHLAIA
jgi:hypoxanthine phosphoribosyltransferase